MKYLWHVLASVSFLILVSCVTTPLQKADFIRLNKTNRAPAEVHGWSAEPEQVRKSVCRGDLPKTTAEVEKYFASLNPNPESEDVAVVEGIRLIGERSDLILALSKLLRPAPMEAVEGPAIPFAKQVSSNCLRVLCAMKQIFGNDVGPKMLFIMHKFDVNTSKYSWMNADSFSDDEITDVIRAFEWLPENLPLPFAANQKLIHFKRGYVRKSADKDANMVLGNATMEFFDYWSEFSSLYRQYALFHEFSHIQANSMFYGYDNNETWLDFSGWKEQGEFKWSHEQAKSGAHPFISEYAAANPLEDFAETLSAYRFNPNALKKRSPKKYEYVKEVVFDGIEFTSESACRQKPEVLKVQKKIDEGFQFAKTDFDFVVSSCRMSFYQNVIGRGTATTFNSCVDYEATLRLSILNGMKFDVVEKGLFNSELKVSRLKFKQLRQKVVEVLKPEAASWLQAKITVLKLEELRASNVNQYCEGWGSALGRLLFPSMDRNSNWQRRGGATDTRYTVDAGSAVGMCLELNRDSEQLQRKITREAVLNYISQRIGK